MDATKFEEILECMWIDEEQEIPSTREHFHNYRKDVTDLEAVLKSIRDQGLMDETKDDYRLTEKGRREAARIVRCHRLAEQLLSNVLKVRREESESMACKFEHILTDEVSDSICTLLGHPRTCPHGKKIPPGACCRKRAKQVLPILKPLTEMQIGEHAMVAFIETQNYARLERLTAYGIIPGSGIKVVQRQPSLVISLDNTQLALDEAIAQHVFVRT